MNFLSTIIRTIWRALFKPSDFFNELSQQYSFSNALVFFCVLNIVIPLLTASIFIIAMALVIKSASYVSLMTLPIMGGFALVYAIVSIISILFATLIMHIFVLLFRGKGRYSGTFNVLVYSNAAAFLYGILIALVMLVLILVKLWTSFLPVIIIALIGSLWLAVIPVIGYRIIHKMGTLRAIGALILPMVIFFILNLFIGSSLDVIKKKIVTISNIKPSISIISQKTAIINTQPPVSGTINWQDNLDGALSAAQRDEKPLMADFYTDWCGWCKKLDSDTYSDQEVRNISGQFICVKVNADNNRTAAERYKIQGYPTIVFLSPKGDLVKTSVGYVDANTLAGTMKDILGKYPPKKTSSELTSLISSGIMANNYKLTAIGFSSGKPNAIINDAIVNVGDTVGEAKVIEIKKNHVVLLQKDKNITLELK